MNATRVLLASLALGLLPGCSGHSMHACVLLRIAEMGRCGFVRVYENRARAAGRQIDLRVVVLRARGREVLPDPIVFLTGGPGLGAAEDVRFAARAFRAFRRYQDVVLVDQRGTGRSAPLDCDLYGGGGLQPYLDPTFPAPRVNACLHKLEGRLDPGAAGISSTDTGSRDAERHRDLTQYTTAVAMDDLAQVLTTLGYGQADIIGVSYGTRAALVFLRRHPDRVRTVTAVSVVPPGKPIMLAAPRATARALAAAGASQEIDTLMARLRRAPVRVTLWNWRRLRRETVTIGPRGFAERVFSLFYSASSGRHVVPLLRQAIAGDWTPFARVALAESRARRSDRSVGMTLSVLCAEDAPRFAGVDTAALAAQSPLGLPVAGELLTACADWPRGPVDSAPSGLTPPVLFVSGALDPATPPEWADSVSAQLPNSATIVVPGAGHSPGNEATLDRIASFVRSAHIPECRTPESCTSRPNATK